MGLLPEEALEDGFAGATIGMEMSGTVVAVGTGVTDLVPGDEVMGIASQALSTHVTVARDGVTKLGIDPLPPRPFLWHFDRLLCDGRTRSHSEGRYDPYPRRSRWVGLAALQIAKLHGAKVIATAGTVEKRRFCRSLVPTTSSIPDPLPLLAMSCA